MMKLLIILQHWSLFPIDFFTSKMIKTLFIALYTDENIFYSNEDSGNVVYSCYKMGFLNIDLNNINLDNNFDEDESDTTTFIRHLAWCIKFYKRKELKEKIAQHPKRWCNFWVSENEKKEIKPNFTE